MSLERPRILLVNAYAAMPDADGMLTLAAALAKLGYRVDVLARRDHEAQPEVSCPSVGVRVTRLNVGPVTALDEAALLRVVPAFVAAAERVMRRDGPYDVIHAHRLLSALVGQRLKEVFGLPLAVSLDVLGMCSSMERLPSDPIGHIRVDIERRVLAHADRVIAQCPQQCTDLQRLYGVEEARLSMASPGVDTGLFRPRDRHELRSRLGLDPQDFIIVQAGRLSAHKGVDNVIRAVGLQRSSVRARLIVIGSEAAGLPGSETTRLSELARQCGVADQVELLGWKPQAELARYLSAANLVVDTPWFEPLGHSPIEGMASGTPVIVSHVGGAAHAVDDGVTGFLVRPRDPQGLAGRIEQLHAQPALALAMGRAGTLRARTVFGWDHIAERLGDAYDALRAHVASQRDPSWQDFAWPLDTGSSKALSPRGTLAETGRRTVADVH